MAAWFARWWNRSHTTDPMVAHQLWLHIAHVDKLRQQRLHTDPVAIPGSSDAPSLRAGGVFVVYGTNLSRASARRAVTHRVAVLASLEPAGTVTGGAPHPAIMPTGRRLGPHFARSPRRVTT